MRLTIISLLFLTSCTKDWNCCIDTTTTHTDSMYTSLNGTTTTCVKFTGTNSERNDYEESGTNTYYETFPVDFTVEQETNCTPY